MSKIDVFRKHSPIAAPHAPPPAKRSLRVPAGTAFQDVHRFALRYTHSALGLLHCGVALEEHGRKTILISDQSRRVHWDIGKCVAEITKYLRVSRKPYYRRMGPQKRRKEKVDPIRVTWPAPPLQDGEETQSLRSVPPSLRPSVLPSLLPRHLDVVNRKPAYLRYGSDVLLNDETDSPLSRGRWRRRRVLAFGDRRRHSHLR